MAAYNDEPSPCANCGNDAIKECGQCHRVVYCNRDCQKADWKKHKHICFPQGAKCIRCLEIIDDNNLRQCQVPHPVHLLDDAGSSFSFGSGGVSTWNFSCRACFKNFTKEGQNYNERDTAPITKGAKFCFSGSHTIKPLPDTDLRRVTKDAMVLNAGPNLQQQIDAIPVTMPQIRILTIQSTGGYDDSIQPKLEVSMPELETLQLIDVAFQKVTLNQQLTPKIEDLTMQNIPDECQLTVLLPELKTFSMHYYGPSSDESWIHEMLATSTKLVTFDSYKLRVGPELTFAGNSLQSINLHRAELLHSLTLYAPNLHHLSLQACYNFEGTFTILDSHPRFAPVRSQSPFVVNTLNACLSPAIQRTLQSNPRIVWEDDGDATNPLEAHFAGWQSGW
ncbi:MYND finger domain containing protein [Nitzschia inconspicua]|uniref:MYND finger domain containing protein n=1 Tax=Nitzschia inconspicua TaxID=303405 RepID=A0A9K3Q8S1_9STRA|nr:MYND finger domain containing protein [Nitzschia inconspicua]